MLIEKTWEKNRAFLRVFPFLSSPSLMLAD